MCAKMWQWTRVCTFILAFGLTLHSCWSYCILPESKGLLAKCYSEEGNKVSCQKLVSPGMIVEFSCKDQYEGTPLSKTRLKCSHVGIWTGQPISCSSECGISEVAFQPYITPREPTTRGQWPWHVAIYLKKDGGWTYHCGGSLIRDDTVLTAANCIAYLDSKQPFDNEEVLVVLGKNVRQENIQEEHSQSRQVLRISVHPEYNPQNIENNLALIFLIPPVEITYDVRTVCSPINESLSEDVPLKEGSIGVVIGFGTTETGELADEKQKATITYIKDSTCRESLLELDKISQMASTAFCAGNLKAKDVCGGDVGSGVVFLYGKPDQQRWYIQGVLSEKLPAKSNSPLPCKTQITFTRVSSFADWIEEEMRQVEDSDKETPSLIEDNMANMIQSAVVEALENALKPLYEKLNQVMLQDEEIASQVNEIKRYPEKLMTSLQVQIQDIKDNVAMEQSFCKASNTMTEDKLNTFEIKLNELQSLIKNNFNMISNQINDLENQIQKLEKCQIGLQEEISFTKDNIKQKLPDKCAGTDSVLHSNCVEIQQSGHTTSGAYKIATSSGVIEVYCDLETDRGGWTVFQRRDDISPHISFNRNWEEYKKGFGDIKKEFWLGLDTLHFLTTDQNMSLRVDMADFQGNRKYAHYDYFLVKNEDEKYELLVGGFHGNAGDSLIFHNEKKFSTLGNDNDESQMIECSRNLNGGWWFHNCATANLNGMYRRRQNFHGFGGIVWSHWRGLIYSLKMAEMKLRPSSF